MKKQNSGIPAHEGRLAAIQTLLCQPGMIRVEELDRVLTPRLTHDEWSQLVDIVLVAERQRITERYPGVDAKRCAFRGQVWRVSSGGLNYTWAEAEDDSDVPPHALPMVLFVDFTTGKPQMHPGLAAAVDIALPGSIERDNPDPKSGSLQKIQHWQEIAAQHLENAPSNEALERAMKRMRESGANVEEGLKAYETAKRLWLAQQESADKTRKNPKAHAIATDLLLLCDELDSLIHSSSRSDDEWLMLMNGAVQAARWHDELQLVGRRGIRKQNAKLLHRRGRNAEASSGEIDAACALVYDATKKKPTAQKVISAMNCRVRVRDGGQKVVIPKKSSAAQQEATLTVRAVERRIDRWWMAHHQPPKD